MTSSGVILWALGLVITECPAQLKPHHLTFLKRLCTTLPPTGRITYRNSPDSDHDLISCPSTVPLWVEWKLDNVTSVDVSALCSELQESILYSLILKNWKCSLFTSTEPYKVRSGPWVSSISIMRELVINANSWPPPDPLNQKLGGGTAVCV